MALAANGSDSVSFDPRAVIGGPARGAVAGPDLVELAQAAVRAGAARHTRFHTLQRLPRYVFTKPELRRAIAPGPPRTSA